MRSSYHRAEGPVNLIWSKNGRHSQSHGNIQHVVVLGVPSMTSQRREQWYRTEAIVLGRIDLGEVDRILTFYSPSRGKFRAVAKGVRRPNSRLAPHLELFGQTRAMFAKGRDLDIVTSAQTVDGHWALRTDLDAFGQASYFVELLNQLTTDREENEAAYELLSRSLRLLAESVSQYTVSRHFELALLSILGFRPEFYACVRCEAKIAAEPNGFSAGLGGMLCPRCQIADSTAPLLSVNAQKYLRLLDREGMSGTVRLELDAATSAEIERALGGYARFHAERESRSLRVMKSIREWSPEYVAPVEGD
jgi:DNA repair protein RecO (recombination protein O)